MCNKNFGREIYQNDGDIDNNEYWSKFVSFATLSKNLTMHKSRTTKYLLSISPDSWLYLPDMFAHRISGDVGCASSQTNEWSRVLLFNVTI